MKNTEKHTVDTLLRKSLLEFAAKQDNIEQIEKLNSNNWKNYIIGEEDDPVELKVDTAISKMPSFLEEKFFANSDWNTPELSDYIKETVITDVFKEKKQTLDDLIVLSSRLNPDFYNLVKKVYDDDELVHLLTLTSDKTYRNGVFYMDEETGALKIKDERGLVRGMSIEDALEFYRLNADEFFIEIQIIC